MGLKPESRDDIDPFEEILEDLKQEAGVELDLELSADDLKELTVRYKKAIKSKLGEEFPQDPREQLWGGIGAVFYSWNIPRAVAYRELNNIPDDMGTAVNVQAMVFGNLGDDSGTGVAFTRNPATGDNTFYGEYLMNAQGEDVVAGTRTPQPINKLQKGDRDVPSLEEEMPDIYDELDSIRKKLDSHYREMQDIEFTIAGHRVHHPEGKALDAPDPLRETYRSRLGENCGGNGGGGPHLERGGSHAGGARSAQVPVLLRERWSSTQKTLLSGPNGARR